MTVWLLGDQLHRDAAPLQSDDHVLMIEAHNFAERMPYHPQKLTLVFSAMRHARDALRADGYDVTYVEAESFGDGLDRYFEANPGDALVFQRPPSHGAGERLRDMVEARGGDCTLVANDGFLTTPAEWDDWADANGGSGATYRQEHWYRHVRRETGVLMDGDDPVGGEWNYDDENRETPPEDWSPPPIPEFEPDAITREVHAFVAERYDDHWGEWGPRGLRVAGHPRAGADGVAALRRGAPTGVRAVPGRDGRGGSGRWTTRCCRRRSTSACSARVRSSTRRSTPTRTRRPTSRSTPSRGSSGR